MKKSKLLKIVYIILSIIAFILLIDSILQISNEKKFDKYIEKITGIDIKQCKKLNYEETHGGFLGDGDTYIEWDCSNIKVSINEKEMIPYPLTEKLSRTLFETITDERVYEYNFGGSHGLPKIAKGYYYFYDDYCAKYKDIRNCKSDENLLEVRASFNFTFIAYDENTKKLYYLEIDT